MNLKRTISTLFIATCAITLVACNDAPQPVETTPPATSNEPSAQQRLDEIGQSIEQSWNEFASKPVQEHVDNTVDAVKRGAQATGDAIERGIEYSNESGYTDAVLDGFEQVGNSFRQLKEQITR